MGLEGLLVAVAGAGWAAGLFNEAHEGSPHDIERAAKLQLASLAERLGLRLIGPAESAVLDRVRDLDRNSVTIMESSEWKPLVALAEAIDALEP